MSTLLDILSFLIAYPITITIIIALIIAFIIWRYQPVNDDNIIVREGPFGSVSSTTGVLVMPLIHTVRKIDFAKRLIVIRFQGPEALLCKDGKRVELEAHFGLIPGIFNSDIMRLVRVFGTNVNNYKVIEKHFRGRFKEAVEDAGKEYDPDEPGRTKRALEKHIKANLDISALDGFRISNIQINVINANDEEETIAVEEKENAAAELGVEGAAAQEFLTTDDADNDVRKMMLSSFSGFTDNMTEFDLSVNYDDLNLGRDNKLGGVVGPPEIPTFESEEEESFEALKRATGLDVKEKELEDYQKQLQAYVEGKTDQSPQLSNSGIGAIKFTNRPNTIERLDYSNSSRRENESKKEAENAVNTDDSEKKEDATNVNNEEAVIPSNTVEEGSNSAPIEDKSQAAETEQIEEQQLEDDLESEIDEMSLEEEVDELKLEMTSQEVVINDIVDEIEKNKTAPSLNDEQIKEAVNKEDNYDLLKQLADNLNKRKK